MRNTAVSKRPNSAFPRSRVKLRSVTHDSALVVEGGGLRGIFASGVLDAFLEDGFNPFGLYIGVSSGAINLSSFLAMQRGRNYQLYLDYATDKNFINLGKFLRGGHWMDLDWFWDTTLQAIPLELDTALKALRNKTFLIVSSSLSTGEPLYLEPNRENWTDLLKASSAVPFMYRDTPSVNIGVDSQVDHLTTDGGVTDPLPVEEAYRRGAKRIVMIRSRPLSCVKGSRLEPFLVRYALRKHPKIHDTVLNQHAIYSQAQAFMDEPPTDLTVHQIAPAKALKTRRAKADPTTLRSDYEEGYAAGKRFMKEQIQQSSTVGKTSSAPL